MANVLKFVTLLLALLHTCLSEKILKLKGKRNVRSCCENNIHGIVEKGYYVETLIGTPPQSLDILIDTGSSNFAVASQPNQYVSKYFHAHSSKTLQLSTAPDVDIQYTEGFWKGPPVRDFVSIPEANLTRRVQVDFVEISESNKFFINGSGWQGILGMAYDEIIRPKDSIVKSFASSVLGTGSRYMENVFSLKLCMADVRRFDNRVSGIFILGGYDRSLYPVRWTPIVREWYYDVRVLGMKVGNSSIDFACDEFNNDKSIIDSGTTNLKLPTKIFKAAVNIMKNYARNKFPSIHLNENFWAGEDDLCWRLHEDPYVLFPEIKIYLPSTEFNHTIALQVHPEHYILFRGNTTRNSSTRACYKFGISSSETGTVLGGVLMEEYNVIFDRANTRIGFAVSDCSPTSVLLYGPGYVNSTDCVYIPNNPLTTTQIVVFVLLGLILLCTFPVCVLMCSWFFKNRSQRSSDSDHLLHTSSTSS